MMRESSKHADNAGQGAYAGTWEHVVVMLPLCRMAGEQKQMTIDIDAPFPAFLHGELKSPANIGADRNKPKMITAAREQRAQSRSI
jgi:hypothetical protein